MLFEFAWKLIGLLVIGIPHWCVGTVDAGTAATLADCAVGVMIGGWGGWGLGSMGV